LSDSNAMSRRWRCLCSYDGTNYRGWQKQPKGQSVQGCIEQALQQTFTKKIKTIGAGRTDAGVHALGQVFHFDAAWRHGSDKLLKALRVRLPEDILPLELVEIPSSFHALCSARGKYYVYRAVEGYALPMEMRYVHSLNNRTLDVASMRKGADHLVGRHDFSSFAASRGRGEVESPIKELWRLEVVRSGKCIKIKALGGGFLYKMVRSIAGALFDVGIGKLEPDDIRDLLESRKRTRIVKTAPARGLCLEKVYYRRPKV
jgi:tRNA pseudouridine38-40 synthase